MANKAERTILARDRAIAAEDTASDQVLDARREVLRLAYHFPDTHCLMRATTRALMAAREALADARRVAEERDRRLDTHRERYDALDDEIQDEILFGGDQSDGDAASAEEIEPRSDASSDAGDSDYEGYLDTLPPPWMPRTRSRGNVSPLSIGETEYSRSLQPRSESEETEELEDQNASDTRPDN